MKRVRFTYVRHGRTEFNRGLVIQGGRVDSPLDPAGIPTIRRTADALAGVPFSSCYSSPLGRAMTTARIILEGRDLPVVPLDDLGEIDFGSIDGKGCVVSRLTFLSHFLRQDFSSLGGESGRGVRDRIRRAFQTMYDRSSDGDEVLVVAHGVLLRYLVLEFSGLPSVLRNVAGETIRVPNASISLVDGIDGEFELVSLPMTAERYLAGLA